MKKDNIIIWLMLFILIGLGNLISSCEEEFLEIGQENFEEQNVPIKLNFDYEGTLNDLPFSGKVINRINPSTGELYASGILNYPNYFDPSIAFNSLISKSCINGGKGNNGALNTISIANNEYVSTREIFFYDNEDQEIGHIILKGEFEIERYKDDTTQVFADATINGYYNGTWDIATSEGYILPIMPVKNESILTGCVEDEIVTLDGSPNIKVIHYQTYEFTDGIKQKLSLEPVMMDVQFDALNTIWNPSTGEWKVTGVSILEPLDNDFQMNCN